jgi:hypothetical protein
MADHMARPDRACNLKREIINGCSPARYTIVAMDSGQPRNRVIDAVRENVCNGWSPL